MTETVKARELLVQLLNQAITAPDKIRASAQEINDPRFTSEALAAERSNRVNTAKALLNGDATKLLTQINAHAERAAAKAQEAWPRLNPNDAAQLQRTAQEWEYNIRPMMGDQPNWYTVLGNLNLDGLIAVERFGPSWIQANTADRIEAAEKVNALMAGVQANIPRAVPDPETRGILQDGVEAVEHARRADTIVSNLRNLNSPDRIGSNGATEGASLSIQVRTIAHAIDADAEIGHQQLETIR